MNNDAPMAVIFDMDGVLADTYHAHYRSWLDVAAPSGLYFTEDEFATTFGRTARETIAHFWGDRCSAEEIAAIDSQKETAFRRMIAEDFPAMPGVVEAIHALHAADFRLAVGSSGPSENVQTVVDLLGVRPLFGAIITGNDVKRGKPDPQVFLLAAQQLNVPPHRCAVIEDAPVGIAAANAAGMATIGLQSTGRTPQDFRDAQTFVRSAQEITPLLVREMIARLPN